MTFNQAEVINTTSFSGTGTIYIVPTGKYAIATIGIGAASGTDGSNQDISVTAGGQTLFYARINGDVPTGFGDVPQRSHTVFLESGDTVVTSAGGGYTQPAAGVAFEFNNP